MSEEIRTPSVEEMQKYSNVRMEPTNYSYIPPEGADIFEAPKNGRFYQADEPSAATDRLLPYERRYVNPIAMEVAAIFGLFSPVPDDIYRSVPEYSKMKNMFCIISRSNIKRLDKGITWEPVVVTVRKFLVVRIECFLSPGAGTFNINRVYMWSKRTQRYEVAEDPQSGTVNPDVIPYILTRYNDIEGITS